MRRDEWELDFLRQGSMTLLADPGRALIGGIEVKGLVAATGVDEGEFQARWPAREEFLRDIVAFTLERNENAFWQRALDRLSDDVVLGVAPRDALIEFYRAILVEIGSPSAIGLFRLELVVAAGLGDDPRLAPLVAELYEEILVEEARLYRQLLTRAGLTARPPLDVVGVAKFGHALLDGVLLRDLRENRQDGHESHAELIADAVLAMTQDSDDA